MSGGLKLQEVSLVRSVAGGAERAVIDDVTVAFGAGRITFITGRTGAGKSTIIALLAGVLRPTRGVVFADGEPLSRWISSHRDRWRQQVGLSLQAPHLLSGLTALENVILPCVVGGRGFGRQRMAHLRRCAIEALEQLHAADLAPRFVETLSGGERQRVAIARALIGRPRYLLLDEPTAHQDDEGVAVIARALETTRSSAKTVVVATHDPRLIAAVDGDALALDRGKLDLGDAGEVE